VKGASFRIYKGLDEIFYKQIQLNEGHRNYSKKFYREELAMCRNYSDSNLNRDKSLKGIVSQFGSFKGDKNKLCNFKLKKDPDLFYQICLSESPMGNVAIILTTSKSGNLKLNHINLLGDTTVFDKFWFKDANGGIKKIYDKYKVMGNLKMKAQLCLNREIKTITSGFDIDTWGSLIMYRKPENIPGLKEKEKERGRE
jgi:hypothetical protein